ncbi:hypothetical protein [Bythopirellula polymerisocia]|uniref:DUF5666 domain-containing protein n=1 Tax=Bythopirellula polymerisocia TaxID=2528003 RepID=A0A5C6CJ52_9BACT|nr:hypothetical protein [Bythopirellula polymerisocia]TWU24620.1 hypothetical protein Pla144_35050 [Bythopirellula polymerisocia]
MITTSKEKKVSPDDTTISKKICRPNVFAGTVVGVSGNKLVMANKEGKQYSHTLADDAQFTCDGTICKAAELTSGTKIRVTTKQNDRRVAIGIEALDTNAEFGKCCS